MNYVPQATELADAKREHEWLRAAPSHILQQTLKDLDKACRANGTQRPRERYRINWPWSWLESPGFGRREEVNRLLG